MGLVLQHGPKWRLISNHFQWHSEDAVRNRFNRFFRVNNSTTKGPFKNVVALTRKSWTQQEGDMLLVQVSLYGRSWHEIAEVMNRTVNGTRNRYERIKRMQHANHTFQVA